jgi:YidC/Oxa1 family membrane protein insertase
MLLLPLANIIESAFSPLISLFEAILVFLHKNIVGGSWGVSIVGLTVIVRAVLMPLTMRQFRSMQAMQRLAPEMKALQEKYKEDKQRQSEELMKFYRENNVNPLASCLPLALQMPVLISLFYALRANLKTDICGKQLVTYVNTHFHTHYLTASKIPSATLGKVTCNTAAPHSAKFLFIPDVTDKATGVVLVVLLVLYVGSQLASSVLMSASADPNQRRLMILLPLVFAVIVLRFPAGVLVYWITTNFWTLGQQYYVRRRAGLLPTRRGKPEDGDGGGGGGGSDSPNGKPPSPSVNGTGKVEPVRRREPALAGAGGGGAPPPPSPRKKKTKRSGKRR